MFFVEIKDFFLGYGLTTCIFAIAIFAFNEILSAIFKGKLHSFFNYLPFISGIVVESVYLLIIGAWNFGDAISLGLVCGSLSEILSAILLRIKNKTAPSGTPKILLIEGIIKDFIPENAVKETAEEIYSLVLTPNAPEKIAEVLAPIIKPDAKAIDIANLIVTSVLSIGKK